MKTWTEKPSRDEAQALIEQFFRDLRAGKLEEARDRVDHAYPDWDESIYTVWQDHYLIHEIPKDNSFEGREWSNQRGWLNDLTTDGGFEWMKNDHVWVNLVYRGEPSGYVGEFAIVKKGDAYCVQRVIFKMA